MDMVDKIDEYIKYLVKIISNQEDRIPVSTNDEEKFNKLVDELMELLLYDPTKLVLVRNKDNIDIYKKVIKKIWELYTDEEIFDNLRAGEYHGMLVDQISEFIESARGLEPTFVSINPDNDEFFIYYKEAMHCWRYGLNNSALIVCSTLLENMLKKELEMTKPEKLIEFIGKKYLKGIQIRFQKAIDLAYETGLITNKSKNYAHEIRIKRNITAHGERSLDNKETLDLILKTKSILEDFLN